MGKTCQKAKNRGVCTHAAHFHVHLSFLGKTDYRPVGNNSNNNQNNNNNNNSTNQQQQQQQGEAQLLSERQRRGAFLPPLPNPVFLYDAQQLNETDNHERRRQFAQDMSDFLQLNNNNNDDDHVLPLLGTAPNTRPEDHSLMDSAITGIMDICLPVYDELRKELLGIGRTASTWILDYFLESPQVTVSSPAYFRHVVSQWKVDPCIERKQQQQQNAKGV